MNITKLHKHLTCHDIEIIRGHDKWITFRLNNNEHHLWPRGERTEALIMLENIAAWLENDGFKIKRVETAVEQHTAFGTEIETDLDVIVEEGNTAYFGAVLTMDLVRHAKVSELHLVSTIVHFL